MPLSLGGALPIASLAAFLVGGGGKIPLRRPCLFLVVLVSETVNTLQCHFETASFQSRAGGGMPSSAHTQPAVFGITPSSRPPASCLCSVDDGQPEPSPPVSMEPLVTGSVPGSGLPGESGGGGAIAPFLLETAVMVVV